MCYMAKTTKPSRNAPELGGTSHVRETAEPYVANVGVRELRQNLSVYLDEIKRGRSFVVTEHGVEVATLKPMPAKELNVLERLVREGKATAPRRHISEIGPALEPVPGEKPLSQILQEMRDEEYDDEEPS
jgi:antitoxin (DNA-binding transcriptional repressor) of toxin-antitoxin stability system